MKVYRSHFSFLHINTFIADKPLYLFCVAHVLFKVPRSLPPHITRFSFVCDIYKIIVRIRHVNPVNAGIFGIYQNYRETVEISGSRVLLQSAEVSRASEASKYIRHHGERSRKHRRKRVQLLPTPTKAIERERENKRNTNIANAAIRLFAARSSGDGSDIISMSRRSPHSPCCPSSPTPDGLLFPPYGSSN